MTTETRIISGEDSEMTAAEIRAALAGVERDYRPKVRTTWGGRVKSITVVTQGPSDPPDGATP